MAGTIGPRFGAAIWAASVAGIVVLMNVNHFAGMGHLGLCVHHWLDGGCGLPQPAGRHDGVGQRPDRTGRRAAEEERRRLAREVHDLIAHSLAVTMLQMSGARLALAVGDTDEALAALADAETAGRSAMAEIHRTVGLLGRDDEGTMGAPTPCAADVPELVEGFRKAGPTSPSTSYGELGAVPMGTGLAAYRVVQESLSNAVKHAPGAPVDLSSASSDGEVDVRVVNPIVSDAPASAAGGTGVRGMAERAELLGGTVAACNGDGTWKVDARLPWSESLRDPRRPGR